MQFEDSTVTVNPTDAATFVLTKLLGELVFLYEIYINIFASFTDINGLVKNEKCQN